MDCELKYMKARNEAFCKTHQRREIECLRAEHACFRDLLLSIELLWKTRRSGKLNNDILYERLTDIFQGAQKQPRL